MTGRIVSFVTFFTLLAIAFFLLWGLWAPEKALSVLSMNRLPFSIGALFLLFLAVVNVQIEGKSLPSYTFHLVKGKGTVSIETLKKGIQTFIQSEDPHLHVVSCQLKEGGKLLELILTGHTAPPLLENLSNLLVEQFGFEGQLNIFFEKPA